MDVPVVGDWGAYSGFTGNKAAPSPGVRCAGRVFTLLRVEEVRHFKGLLRKVDNAYVRDYALDKGALEALRPGVAHALGVLQAYLSAHAAGA